MNYVSLCSVGYYIYKQSEYMLFVDYCVIKKLYDRLLCYKQTIYELCVDYLNITNP